MVDSANDNSQTESLKGSISPLRRTATPSEGSRSRINLLASLRRHWLIAASIALVMLAGGAFVLWKKDKPAYESHSVVYVSPKFPKILEGDTEVDYPYDSYIQNQIQTVTRYDIIADAVTALPYAIRHRSGPALPYEIQLLQQTLEVKRVGSTYEMTIGLTAKSPDGLAETVNRITDTYVEKVKSEEFYGLDQRLSTLRQEKDRLQSQMDDYLSEQAQLMQQLGVATISSAEGSTNPYDSTLQTLRGQLSAARMQREAAEAQLAAVVKGSGNGGAAVEDAAADQAIASDSGLASMRSTLNNRRAALMEEMNGLRTDHPIYQKDMAELASIQAMISDLQQKAGEQLRDRLRQEVSRTRMVEIQLERELADNTRMATSAAPKFQRAMELGPEIENLQKAYDAINNRIRDLELESSSPGSIHVSSRALTPLGPEHSRVRIFAFALIALSLAGAIGAAVLIDILDNRIYTPLDVERVVGFHPIGVLLDNHEFRGEIASEYYLRLAAGIDHAVRSAGARVFLFTSTAHGSGTSTIVRELSETLRSMDLKTRTIAAAASEGLGVSFGDGFWRSQTLLLQSRSETAEISTAALAPIIVPHEPKTRTAGSDSPAPNPVMQALRHGDEKCDVILIDANPLPISAQTEYLARLADATLLVVGSGATTSQELDRSARLLERIEVRGVAVILNKMRMERTERALRKELQTYEQTFRRRRAASAKSPAAGPKPEVEKQNGEFASRFAE